MPSRPRFTASASPAPLPSGQLAFLPSASFSRSKIQKKPSLVLGLAVGGSIAAAIAFIVFLLLLYRRLRGSKTSPYDGVSENLQRYSYRALKAATGSFAEGQKLGQGGFGAVYKGKLRNGTEIAVKVLDTNSVQGEREFQNEVSVIGKVSSPHIVGLLGFCADRKRKLLVYEFMRNRSLQDALFDDKYSVQLDWGKRFGIIMDAAKGLAFLHTKCEPAIIHGDIKPSNILLDGGFSARIADFGLARPKVEDPEQQKEDLEGQKAEGKRDEAAPVDVIAEDDKSVREETESVMTADLGFSTVDGDQGRLGNMQSPETYGSSSVSPEQNPGFLSCSASPEGLNDETETVVTETHDERTPSEIVDLEKNMGMSSNGIVAKTGSVDCRSTDFSRDDDDKMSIDSGRKKTPTKDWWWRQQDSSGEFSVKDYVMEWIGTEIKKERPRGSERDLNPGGRRKKPEKRPRREKSFEWWVTLAEEDESEEPKKKEKSKSRERREWWREEFCEELSQKSNRSSRRVNSRSRSRDWFRDEPLPLHHHSRDWGSGDVMRSGVSSTPSMRGTVCYVAPEYGGGGALSERGDVYSFGVLLLVIISGRRPLQVMASPMTHFERANLISWARHLARSGNVLDLVDATLGEDYDKTQALLCITVALLCLQRSPASRPAMTEVVKILSGEVEAPSLPFEFSPSPPYGFPFRSRRKASCRASPAIHA